MPERDPKVDPRSSGKFVIRAPRSLHAALIKRAKQEGISLNQLVAMALAEESARRREIRKLKPSKWGCCA